MNACARRQRIAPMVWCLVFLALVPPGFVPTLRAAQWDSALTRDTEIETLRNPMISSASVNRFLFTDRPQDLVGGGGESFLAPQLAGYGAESEPSSIWLTNDGRLQWAEVDATAPGRMPFAFKRIYRGSVASYDGPLGKRWDFSWNKRISRDGNDIILIDMGREERYASTGGATGPFTSPEGRYDTIVAGGSFITRTDRYGREESYELKTGTSYYALESETDLNGNVILYSYTSGLGQLTRVQNSAGYYMDLLYDSSGRITKVNDESDASGTRTWQYEYDLDDRLTAVITPTFDHAGNNDFDFLSGKETRYLYDSDDRLEGVVLPQDVPSPFTSAFEWQYDAAGQAGKITKQLYDGDAVDIDYDPSAREVTVTSREGDDVIYFYDTNLLITTRREYSDATTYHDTNWAYNSDAEVTLVTFPNGNQVKYAYDSGNITKVELLSSPSDVSPITWDYEYGAFARLTSYSDPNGHEWSYDYDGNGNLTSKTWPAVTLPSGIASTNNNSHLNATNDGTIVQTWEYDSYGNITTTTDPLGTTFDAEYIDGPQSTPVFLGKLIGDPSGVNVTRQWAYDGHGNAITFTDPNGNAYASEYDTLDQVIMDFAPGGVTAQYFRDLNDYLTRARFTCDADAGDSWFVVDYERDRLGKLLTTITDFDASTRVTTEWAYDKSERLTSVIDPGAMEIQYAYDGRDLVTSVTRKAASASNDSETIYAYDDNGCLTSSSDPRDSTYLTVFDRDGYDRVTKATFPEGNGWTSAYDDSGNVTRTTGFASGGATLADTRYAFDEANRLYEIDRLAQDASGANIGDGWQTQTVWRDESGAVLFLDGDVQGLAKTELKYDALRRPVTLFDAMPTSPSHQNVEYLAYDLGSRLTALTREEASQDTGIEADKTIVMEYQYDDRDNVTKARERLSVTPSAVWAETTFEYDVRNQVTQMTDAEGRVSNTDFNEVMWPVAHAVDVAAGTANDLITEFEYDTTNRRVTRTASNGVTGDQQTVMEYDRLGRMVATTMPDGEDFVTVYDKASNWVTHVDAVGTTRVASYDDNGRLTTEARTLAANVSGADCKTFSYDGLNRLSTAGTEEPSGYTTAVEWDYNTLSLVEVESLALDGSSARSVTSTWDEVGRRTEVAYPDGATDITYARDDLDRISTVDRDASQIAEFTYAGWRTLAVEFVDSKATYLYDGYGRVTEIDHDEVDTAQDLATFEYLYDKTHYVTAQDRYYYDDVQSTRITADASDIGEQYAYDAGGRLVTTLRGVASADITSSVASNAANSMKYDEFVEYEYDQTDNRTTRTVDGVTDVVYEHNAVNEMTTEDGVGQRYDKNGNDVGLGGVRKYDAESNLVLDTTGVTYTFHFDAIGRLVAREAGASVRWYYDGGNIVQQYRLSGATETLKKTYVYADGLDSILEYTDHDVSGDTSYSMHRDRLGSVALLVDGGGDIQESYRYSEFGETTVVNSSFVKSGSNSSPVGNWYRFTGRRQHNGLGSADDDWYHYRARAMRTNVGRFVQRDPMGYYDGSNLYSYVGANPVNFTDPTGEFAILAAIAVVVAVVEVAFTVVDVVDTVSTLTDPEATTADKMLSVGGLAAGALLPGGGYGVGGKAAARSLGGTRRAARATRGGRPVAAPVARGAGRATSQKVDDVAEAVWKVKKDAKEAVTKLVPSGPEGSRYARKRVIEPGHPGELEAVPVWCFVAGTEVHGVGGLVCIEDVAIGDRVLAYDFDSSRTVTRRVSEVAVNFSDAIVEVVAGQSTLRTTEVHPFWVLRGGNERWVAAGDVQAGDQLRTVSGGWLGVDAVISMPGWERVYNFEVEQDANYYVGREGILVHNGPDDTFGDYNQARNAALDWLGDGFKAEKQVPGKFGIGEGKPIGMQTADGLRGFRVEWEPSRPGKPGGAHINVWDWTRGKKPSGHGPHFRFPASEAEVGKLQKRFKCKG